MCAAGGFTLCCLGASTDCVVSLLGFAPRLRLLCWGLSWRPLLPSCCVGVPAVALAQIAVKYSECSSSKAGGNLGWFPRGKMEGKFQEKAFGNAPGTCTEPYVAGMTRTLRRELALCGEGGVGSRVQRVGWQAQRPARLFMGVSVPARACPPCPLVIPVLTCCWCCWYSCLSLPAWRYRQPLRR